jgi:hypothetical protein
MSQIPYSSTMNLTPETFLRLHSLYQQINDTIAQAQMYSNPPMSVPLRTGAKSRLSRPAPSRSTHVFNPNAKEFVPQQASVPASQRPVVRFSDILQEGESVYLTVGIGRYEDGYPILTAVVARYENNGFHVTACDEVPSMIGRSSQKPGTLLYEFIRGLKRKGLLRRQIRASVWKHCHVKRNGSHISFSRLANNFTASTTSSSS